MPEEKKQETVTESETGGGEGKVETIAVPKADYDKLNETIGSMKRELKDLKKASVETKETPIKETKTEEFGLVHKTYLRAAGIVAEDEVELALTTAKKWGVDIDKVVDDEDFKVKLEKLRTTKSNELAASNIKGSAGSSQAKNTPEYWIAKGQPPSPTDIPDRKTRAKIARAFLAAAQSGDGKKFYNE